MCKGKIKGLINKNVSKVVVCNIVDSNDVIDEYENIDDMYLNDFVEYVSTLKVVSYEYKDIEEYENVLIIYVSM